MALPAFAGHGRRYGYSFKNGEESQINFRGIRIGVKVSGKNSDGCYSLFEITHPANVGPALHMHPKTPEAYDVLEGEYSAKCGNKTTLARAGDFLSLHPKERGATTSQARRAARCLPYCQQV